MQLSVCGHCSRHWTPDLLKKIAHPILWVGMVGPRVVVSPEVSGVDLERQDPLPKLHVMEPVLVDLSAGNVLHGLLSSPLQT